MILLDRVTKVYGKGTAPSLDRISLHVEPKEFVIVVGQSGAGKTTLLRLLTREERPSAGKIIIGGVDYDKLRDRDIPLLRRKIGVVFQDFKLLPNKTVFENVAFALEIVGMSKREIQHTVPKVLDIVNLRGKEKNMPMQLSGGERQRVAIARAIVRQPKILIADEPTGNLDPKHAWDVIKILEKINRYGTTVLLTTHNMEIVNRLKRRVVTMEHGHIASDRAESGSQPGTGTAGQNQMSTPPNSSVQIGQTRPGQNGSLRGNISRTQNQTQNHDSPQNSNPKTGTSISRPDIRSLNSDRFRR